MRKENKVQELNPTGMLLLLYTNKEITRSEFDKWKKIIATDKSITSAFQLLSKIYNDGDITKEQYDWYIDGNMKPSDYEEKYTHKDRMNKILSQYRGSYNYDDK